MYPQPPQGQPPGQYPGQYHGQYPGYPPPPQGGNGMAVASFVLALIGLFLFGVILGPLAVIFGALGIGKARKLGGKGKGLAIAGLVIGIIAVVVNLFVLAVLIADA